MKMGIRAVAFVCILVAVAALWINRDRNEQPAPLLIFGIDAVGWDALDRMRASGAMPHLSKAVREGVTARLETLKPTVSVMLWTSMVTGLLPERHGISNWLAAGEDGAGQLAITSDFRRAHAIWNLKSSHRYLFLNWWASWPAESIDGIMVSNRAHFNGVNQSISPETEHNLLDSTRRIGKSDLETELSALNPEKTRIILSDFVFNKLQTDRFYLDLADTILARGDTSIAGVFVRGIDILEHEFLQDIIPFPGAPSLPPESRGLVRAYYAYLDGWIGRLLKHLGPDARICVVSDHGMDPMIERPPYIEGLRLDDLLTFAGLIDRTPEGLPDLKSAPFHDNKKHNVGLTRGIQVHLERIQQDQNKDPIAELIARLSVIKLDGKPIFSAIDYGTAPDEQILVTLESVGRPDSEVTVTGRTISLNRLVSMIIHPSSGQHWNAPHGIFISSGQGIRNITERQEIRLIDVMPTIVRWMNLPLARDLDGQPKHEFFTDEFARKNPVHEVPSYGEYMPERRGISPQEVDHEIRNELKSLGYIQ